MNNLKIGQRLYAGFTLVLLLLVAVAILAWYGLKVAQDATERVVEMERRASLTQEWLMSTQLNINRVLAVAKSRNDSAVDAHFKPLIAETTKHINELQAMLESDLTSTRGRALLAEINGKRSEYIAVRKTYFDALQAGQDQEAGKILQNGMLPAANAYGAKQKELLDFQSSLVQDAVRDSAAMVKRQVVTVLALAASAVVLALLLSWRITRSVTQPLDEAVAISRRVAQGDLTQDVKTDRRDELGQLLQALAEMRMSLLNTVSQVRQATDSIGTASVEIATGNQDLSRRTEQTASNLEETAASMEELNSTVRNSADAARQANQLAASAAEIAARGGQVVGQVVSTMEDISHSSQKISDIIGVIDGIAFQTNILALNAAVEAARAGEQGRGFAVVAGEVRSLAQRSAEAAKEIKQLIGTSVEKVEAGTRLVGDAGSTMEEIVGSVQRVSDIIGEITAAAGEQSEGIGQVNVAVNQLDQMTQQNAALVEQSAAAAESLKEQAQRLAEVVRVFRVDGHAAVTASGPVSVTRPAAVVSRGEPKAAVAGKPVAEKLGLKRPALAATAAQPVVNNNVPAKAAKAVPADEDEWESF